MSSVSKKPIKRLIKCPKVRLSLKSYLCFEFSMGLLGSCAIDSVSQKNIKRHITCPKVQFIRGYFLCYEVILRAQCISWRIKKNQASSLINTVKSRLHKIFLTQPWKCPSPLVRTKVTVYRT